MIVIDGNSVIFQTSVVSNAEYWAPLDYLLWSFPVGIYLLNFNKSNLAKETLEQGVKYVQS